MKALPTHKHTLWVIQYSKFLAGFSGVMFGLAEHTLHNVTALFVLIPFSEFYMHNDLFPQDFCQYVHVTAL
jgi:hypothetical protein